MKHTNQPALFAQGQDQFTPDRGLFTQANRTGQTVQPDETYCYRPLCTIESSTSKILCGKADTLHVILYPDGEREYLWESEWGYKFQPA
jgi:hypothetical protein